MFGRVIAAVAVIVGISSAASAQGDRGDIVGQIHEQITKDFTRYKAERKTKALAGCINWEASTPDKVNVRHLFYYYTGEGSDRDFLPSQLMRSAVNACNKLRKKAKSSCKCMPIDKNGRSALKVPNSFIKKFLGALLVPPKPEVPSAAQAAVGTYPSQPSETFRDCPECPEMAVIPAGSFKMGSARFTDEGPPHRVTIPRHLALGKYEVTFAEWDACVKAGGCSHRPADQGSGRNDRPVMNVSWHDAKEYVAWLSRKTGQDYRLPSEAEWEYAARAGTMTDRYWDLDENADRSCDNGNFSENTGSPHYLLLPPNYCADGFTMLAPVGSFRPNDFGLQDTLGNVFEWVEDCWNDSYSGAPSDGRAWTTGECNLRVARGGSWQSYPLKVRATGREWFDSGDRINFIGFRVAKTLP